MNYRKYLVVPLFLLISHWSIAQPGGEASEPSPEELDAAFTAQDAAREAAAWSDVVIDRSNPNPLGRMAAASDLVFRGTVKSEEVVYDENDLPFTRTTFTIAQVLSGDYSDAEITVVQEGGPSRKNEENFVIVSDAQHFNVGDEELLFMALDPDNAMPERRVTVRHRFSIYDGKVYDDNGHGLLLTPSEEGAGYRLQWSRDRNPAPRFSQIHIGSHTLTKVFSDEDNSPDSGGDVPAQGGRLTPDYHSSVDVATFSAAITE